MMDVVKFREVIRERSEMSDEWIKNCIEYNDKLGMSKSYATYLYCKEIRYRQRMGIKIEDSE